jgi:DNA 3'-phosphatase
MKKRKLLITDLDGTLIETLSGDTFPKGIWDMKLKLYVFEAIKNYAPDDILIISNQGGIEKGFVDKEMFEYKFDYISNALEDYTDISVSAYYCESNNKRNVNRKPNIGMIKEYMDFIEYMNNDEDEELMIGDASGKEGQFSDSDKKTAENFGCEYMDVDDFVYKYNNR